MNLTSTLTFIPVARVAARVGPAATCQATPVRARTPVRPARPTGVESVAEQAEGGAEAPSARAGRGVSAAFVRERGAAQAASTKLRRLARGARWESLGGGLAGAWRYATGKARLAIAGWEHRRETRALYRALRELHPHTLRDLGIDSGSLRSVAAEATGAATATRLRLDRALRGLY